MSSTNYSQKNVVENDCQKKKKKYKLKFINIYIIFKQTNNNNKKTTQFRHIINSFPFQFLSILLFLFHHHVF